MRRQSIFLRVRDCRIATSAIVGGLTVVTANIRHFEQIAQNEPALQFEDWSAIFVHGD